MLSRSSVLLLRCARPQVLARRVVQIRLQSTDTASSTPSSSSEAGSTSSSPASHIPTSPFPPSFISTLSRTLHTKSSQLHDPPLQILDLVASVLVTHPLTADLKLEGPEIEGLSATLGEEMKNLEKDRSSAVDPEAASVIPPPTVPTRVGPPLTRKQRGAIRRFLAKLSWAPHTGAPVPTLSYNKLRLLTQLYHKTVTFPHPAALEAYIDPVLAPVHNISTIGNQSAKQLMQRVNERRSLPSLIVPGRGTGRALALDANPAVSQDLGEYPGAEEDYMARMPLPDFRTAEVFAALTGTERATMFGRTRAAELAGPGLDALREAEGRPGWEMARGLVKVRLRGERPLVRPIKKEKRGVGARRREETW